MKKLLPPTMFLLFAILMGIICWGFGFTHNITYPYNLIGIPILILGLAIAKVNKKLFLKLETNVDTFEQPDRLVKSGFYKFTRNPMYLGFLISLSGIAVIYQGSISSFLLVLIFFVIVDLWYIRFEEKAMLDKFGKEYQEYCQNTRRWI
jgi:protein-S-isoprenylcysteine O-methyltransferase Ste14